MTDTSIPAPPPARSRCLSEADVSRVRGASAGEVPEELARHLATCDRCQGRVLFGAVRRTRRRREMPPMPTSKRALVLLAVMAAALVAFFITLHSLVTRF